MELNKEYILEDIYLNQDKYSDFLDYPGYLIYRLHNLVNNKSYIGDTKENLRWRLLGDSIIRGVPYKGHILCAINRYNTHLYSAMVKYGLDKFTVSVVSVDNNETESMYIDLYDSYYNGYNKTKNGKGMGPVHTGMILMNDTISRSSFVDPKNIDKYLSMGWRLGRLPGVMPVGVVRIFKDDIERRVPREDLQKFLNDGWSQGANPNNKHAGRGKIKVHDDNGYTFIDSNDLDYYLSLGYKKGQGFSVNSGRVNINKDGVNKRVKESELDSFLSDGWDLGGLPSKLSGTIRVNKNGLIKSITPDELNDYLEDGWLEGNGSNALSGKIAISKPGEVGCKYVLDDHEIIDSYLNSGWIVGRSKSPTKGSITAINEVGDFKVIRRSQILEYHRLGYRRGRKWVTSIPFDKIEEFNDLFIE